MIGARRCIGRAIAVALAGEGARIVVHYRSQRDQVDATVEALRSDGTDAIAVGGDLSDSGAVAALFDETHTHFGGVDMVVANAGTTAPLNGNKGDRSAAERGRLVLQDGRLLAVQHQQR